MGRPSPPLAARTPTHTIPEPGGGEGEWRGSGRSSPSAAPHPKARRTPKWLNKGNLSQPPPPLRLAGGGGLEAGRGARGRAGATPGGNHGDSGLPAAVAGGRDGDGSEMAALPRPASPYCRAEGAGEQAGLAAGGRVLAVSPPQPSPSCTRCSSRRGCLHARCGPCAPPFCLGYQRHSAGCSSRERPSGATVAQSQRCARLLPNVALIYFKGHFLTLVIAQENWNP